MLATPDAKLSCLPSAPADVVVRLGVEIGVPVAVRRRLSLVDDQPVALCHSYYAADLVRGTAIARPRLIRGGALRTVYDGSGGAVEVQDTVASCDRHAFRHEVDL